ALVSIEAARAGEPLTVASPDGSIIVTVSDEGGAALYSASFHGETVIAPSRLGLLFREQAGFDKAVAIASGATASADDTWEQPWGERRFIRDRHNELAVEFVSTDKPARRMMVRFRVFDDGIGFRYEIPKQKALGKVDIVEELTQFAVPDDQTTTAWWIPARRYNRYEYIYETTPLAEVMQAHTPMTMRLKSGAHLSIHEAALVDYGAMVLDQQRPGVIHANITPWSDGVRVKTQTPFKSPWRTIQITKDAVGLLNSNLILNLNEPNKLGDVSWVEPGKYVGVWWGMHINENTWGSGPHHGATTEETKKYIDFAAANGFNGVLVEGWNVGWDGDWYDNGAVFSFTEAYPDFDIEEIGRYAVDKGVRLIGHHETSGHVSNYEAQLKDAFDLYERVGVRTVKTGYVADAGRIQRVGDDGVMRYEWHDGQFQVGHHLRVVEEAAKHRISINPHEPVKDTGLRRTYPNWISREGARGMEFSAWGVPPNPPEHEAVLAYTRMLSGPMDYTPGIFDLEPSKKPDVSEDLKRHSLESRVQTTLAKQLALYVVLYSPIQMAADLPENYARRPEAFQFIKDVPTDWEESIGLAGEVGDYVAFARKERNGADWFIGAVGDENARELS
ncbi:MAG: glycoside hydrolase family 97 catalytic domain-containing protein, partial [Amphiplicatus sp.]